MKIKFCCKKMKNVFDDSFLYYDKQKNKMIATLHTGIGTPGEMTYSYEISFCPFCGEKIV